MKKIVLSILLFIMFIPVFVMAETCEIDKITIESITVDNKTGTANEKRDAVVDDKTIDLDISMNNPGDSITYKLTVKNDSNSDFELDKNSLNANNSEYIHYTFSENDDSVIIKAKSTKDVYLKIEYENEIPVTAFNSGRYNIEKTVSVNLSVNNSIVNPSTGVKSMTIVLLILLSISVITYLLIHDNPYLKPFIIILGLIIIPVGIHAACKCDIVVNSNIEISKFAEFDRGYAINNKLLLLSGDRYNIQSFRRSFTLPDDIKSLVDSQLSETNNIIVTDEEVNSVIEEVNDNISVFDYLNVRKENNTTYYCEYDYCYDKETIIHNLLAYTDLFVYAMTEEENGKRYVFYDVYNDNIDIISEEAFKEEVRKVLIERRKLSISKNILSSNNSDYIIYGWYDDYDKTIYYYCANDKIYFNVDSSYFYAGMRNLNQLDGINNIDLSNTKYMNYMLAETGANSNSFVINLSNWNTSNVVDFTGFLSCGTAEGEESRSRTWAVGNLSNWDVSNVRYMTNMFAGSGFNATSYVLDLSNWNTSNVVDMSRLFYFAGFKSSIYDLGNIGNWDVSNVTTMEGMFYGVGGYAETMNFSDLSNWDVSNVTNMSSMFNQFFERAHELTPIGISSWDVSNVKYMLSMFSYSGSYSESWNIGDLSNWNIAYGAHLSGMFNSAGLNSTTWNSIGTLNIRGAEIGYWFDNCPNAKATINFYGKPSYVYRTFNEAATMDGAEIIVNYTSDVTNIDDIINTKTSGSHVVKGELLEN